MAHNEFAKKKDDEFIKKFNIDINNINKEQLLNIANKGDAGDFRGLCNSFSYTLNSFSHKPIPNEAKQQIEIIKENCNIRAQTLLGKNLLLMERFDYTTQLNAYKYFTYEKPLAVYRRYLILSVILTHNYIGKEIDLRDLILIVGLLSGNEITDIYYANTHSDQDLKKVDKIISINAWIEFTDQIFYKKYDDAYATILKYC